MNEGFLEFDFGPARLCALASGGLWWPQERIYCASDLHLGKSERIARRGGGLLPPYESQETLERLSADLDRLSPDTVISLGDSFDDTEAARQLDPEISAHIRELQKGRRWIWIAGNHDPLETDLGGEHFDAVELGGVTFRHETDRVTRFEISGHYHPKARLSLKGRGYSKGCFLFDRDRIIMPAFGAFTGGLRTDDPVLCDLMPATSEVILTGKHMARLPMPRRKN